MWESATAAVQGCWFNQSSGSAMLHVLPAAPYEHEIIAGVVNPTDSLLGLLIARGVDPRLQCIVLMRHKDGRYPLQKYIGTHALTLYQAMQPPRYRMEIGTLIVSVYGHKPGAGLLLGVWRVRDRMPASQAVAAGLTKGSFEPVIPDWPGFFHDLVESELLSDLRLKLEVQWHGGERTWFRILSAPKRRSLASYPVSLRLQPAIPFLGLSQASLVFAELRLALHELDWQQALSAFSGVYLISDELEGNHYVGSAYGGNGFLGRWQSYAATGHGGNQRLIQLLGADPDRARDFRFTVLEQLPLGTAARGVIAREAYWKVALGSRTFGLNLN